MENNNDFKFFKGWRKIQKADCNILKYKKEDNYGKLEVYGIFPGVKIAYCDINIKNYNEERFNGGYIIEINHCFSGRFQTEPSINKLYHICEGDFAISRYKSSNCKFSSENYKGITISIEEEIAKEHLKNPLEEVFIDIEKIKTKFLKDKEIHFIRATEEIEKLFNEIYNIPKEIRKGYLKLKVLEILLVLSSDKVDTSDYKDIYNPSENVKKIKEIQERLTSNLRNKTTIKELAEEYNISQTALKKSFKEISGESIHRFVKRYKMGYATKLLKETDYSISYISNEVGYESPSKFSIAFKKELGVSPMQYRKEECLIGVFTD